VVAGDAFTIDGIEAVHHITKESTGQLKTFRVISVPAGGTTLVISPPIIAATAPATDAELQYKNVQLVAAASSAPINWLNTGASAINVFWQKDSLEILPGRYAIPAVWSWSCRSSTTSTAWSSSTVWTRSLAWLTSSLKCPASCCSISLKL
jgi:hypothetical protein